MNKFINKTLKSGFSMPAIGKGTWMTNIGHKPRPSLKDDARIEEIKLALDNGITYIDTAERYANGYEETLIGKAIKGRNREKLFLVSKVSSDHLGYDDVIQSAKSSIKRMQAQYLDLFLIHQFNPEADLKETMKALDFLIEKKLVKNIGVCNFSVKELQEAQSFTKNKIVANQIHYNVSFREPEQNGVMEYCRKQDIMVIAWRPYEQELLTKKSRVTFDELAAKYGKTPSQIAAAWLSLQNNVVILSKLTKLNDIEKTIDAIGIKIEPKDIEKFNKENN